MDSCATAARIPFTVALRSKFFPANQSRCWCLYPEKRRRFGGSSQRRNNNRDLRALFVPSGKWHGSIRPRTPTTKDYSVCLEKRHIESSSQPPPNSFGPVPVAVIAKLGKCQGVGNMNNAWLSNIVILFGIDKNVDHATDRFTLLDPKIRIGSQRGDAASATDTNFPFHLKPMAPSFWIVEDAIVLRSSAALTKLNAAGIVGALSGARHQHRLTRHKALLLRRVRRDISRPPEWSRPHSAISTSR